MDRRDFLSNALAAGTGSAAVSAIGCAPTFQQLPREVITDDEAEEILARLSHSLPAARDARLVSGIVRAERPAAHDAMRDYLDVADELASKALTGLVIGGAFGQIPAGKVANERVKQRLVELSPDLDEHLVAATALLAQMPARQKADLDDAFRGHAEIPMRVGELLDRHAGGGDFAPSTRFKLRRVVADLTARLRTQRFSVVCDEYLDKMHRLAAFHADEVAFAREVASHATVAALYAHTMQVAAPALQAADREAPPARAPLPPLVVTPGRRNGYEAPESVPPTFAASQARRSTTASHPGSGTMLASAVIAGIGVGALGISGIIQAAGSRGAIVVGLTIGAIMLAIALIVLIIGAIQYAAA